MTEHDPLPPETERRRVLSPMLDAGDFEPPSVVVTPEFGAASRPGPHRPANDAARRMLHIDAAVEGRHYPEIVRQPAVAEQIEIGRAHV